MKLEQLSEVKKWGNSGGVLLPREWLGMQVKVTLVDRTSEIKKEVLKILESYLEDVIGIYLVGSYSRGEQGKNSDVDILVVSREIEKSIKLGKYEIEITPMRKVLWFIKNYPAIIYPKFIDAKPILNKGLLEEIKEIEVSKNLMNKYLEDCKRILKIDKKFVEEDKSEGEVLESNSVVYSSVLRLRALYMMEKIFQREKYSNRNFKNWLIANLEINKNEFEKIYSIYGDVRDNKEVKERISTNLAEKLIKLLENEIEKYGEEKKTS